MSADLVVIAVAVGLATVGAIAVGAKVVRPRVGRIVQSVESSVKGRLFPARHLNLLALQQRIVTVALSGVDTSVSGARHLGSVQTIQVSPSDHTRLAKGIDGGLDRVHVDLANEIARRAAKLGYTVPDRIQVRVVQSVFALDGRPIRLSAAPIHEPIVAPAPVVKAAPMPDAAPTPDPAPTRDTAPVTGVAPSADAAPSVETTRSTELPAPPTGRRRVVDPLMLRGTEVAATRRWGSDETVNIDEASLVPTVGGKPVRLAGRRTVVGRGPDADTADADTADVTVDVAIDDGSVSARHADLLCEAGLWSVVDKQSTNGTYVNGQQVRERVLTDGDYVRFSSEGPTYVFRLRPGVGTPVDQLATRRSR